MKKHLDIFDGNEYIIIPEEKTIKLESQNQVFKKTIDFSPIKKRKKSRFEKIKRLTFACGTFLFAIVFISGISRALFIKDELKLDTKTTFSGLQNKINEKGIENSLDVFHEAKIYLSELEQSIDPLVYKTSDYYGVSSNSEVAQYLLKVGQNISNASSLFLNAYKNATQEGESNYLKIINQVESDFTQAIYYLNESKLLLQKIKKSNLKIPQIDKIEKILSETADLIKKSYKHFPALKILLGDKHPHTALFLLQNSNEIRANGGFIGSLYFVTFNDGEIIKKEFRDVYDFDSNLSQQIIPPEPFQLISDNWGLRDANYYIDFQKSAEKIQWFLEHEKANSVDTIIAINQNVAEDILKELGIMKLFGVNENVNHNNFTLTLSFIVEAKVFGKKSPKDILKRFIPIFEKRLMKIDKQKLASIGINALYEKNVIFYSFNDQVQDLFNEFNLTQKIKNDDKTEQFIVSHTSFSGNKSDAFINEKISHKNIINLDGKIFGEINIQRAHTWNNQDEAFISSLYEKYKKSTPYKESYLKNIMGKGTNRVYTRVYLPKGAHLVSTDGILKREVKIHKEDDFTVMAFYFPFLKPQEMKNVSLKYKLPFELDFKNDYASHYFCFKKAFGIKQNLFEHDLHLEKGISVLKSTQNMPIKETLNRDKCYGVLISK
ncbi:MAG: DUF4012 domain-containing protein [Candidatus Gracilibacteria bacterium]|jgi:hypothetical protein|nr:DUF4012 domain-containing protein [Candidatus Gracilibacteria bacterium]